MNYRVTVPPPKAKRMVENRKLIVRLSSGWEGGSQFVVPISKLGSMEFTVPDGYEWIHDTSCSDGDTFDVIVEYENDAGTRKETYHLVPERVK